MKRIDDRTVELNPAELKVRERFDTFLDTGFSIVEAAEMALAETIEEGHIFDPNFVAYISEDTLLLKRSDRTIVRTALGRLS